MYCNLGIIKVMFYTSLCILYCLCTLVIIYMLIHSFHKYSSNSNSVSGTVLNGRDVATNNTQNVCSCEIYILLKENR